MKLKPIRSEADLKRALARMDALWEAKAGTTDADELEVLSILVERYESEHFPIPVSDPVAAILFRMEQRGLSRTDLERYIGASGRVSEVLSRKRGLSLAMIHRLHKGLDIPYETLLQASGA